jgi:hypothetical protein
MCDSYLKRRSVRIFVLNVEGISSTSDPVLIEDCARYSELRKFLQEFNAPLNRMSAQLQDIEDKLSRESLPSIHVP